MSAVLRATNSKQTTNKFGFEMVCNENSHQQKLANRRSAVERLEETKANYVKTERVLDCKQNFEYSSNLHVSTGPQIDALLKSRVNGLYNCQNIIKYVHNITLTDDNASPPFTSVISPKKCCSYESRKSPEFKENSTSQRKDHLQRSYLELNDDLTDVDTDPRPPSRGKRTLPQPIPNCSRLNVSSCTNLSYDSGQYDFERESYYANAEKLVTKLDHSGYDEHSLEPSDSDFPVEAAEVKKQSSMTSDYVSRSSSFKCSLSSDRVKNLVKTFETKIHKVTPYSMEKTKPVTRSKSDVNCRFSRSICVAPEPSNTTDAELERFFDTMGLDHNMFKSLTAPPKSPIHFFDSVSSVNSDTNASSAGSEESASVVPQKEGLTNSDLRKHAPTETSIVEKNARVVKWLYNCHNEYRKSTS